MRTASTAQPRRRVWSSAPRGVALRFNDDLDLPPRTSERVIVTLAVGPQFAELLAISEPSLRDYARRCRADFVAIRSGSVAHGYAMGEKFRLPRFFDHGYCEVLYLDADLIVMPTAPDLYGLLPTGADSAMHDDYSELSQTEWLDQEYQSLIDSQGWGCAAPQTCFNTGVMLATKYARELFTLPDRSFPESHTAEQSLININADRRGLNVWRLPREWNEQWWPNHRITSRPGTHIYHWANAPHHQRLTEMTRLAAEIAAGGSR